jgi:Family of unknown function (DUF6011)
MPHLVIDNRVPLKIELDDTFVDFRDPATAHRYIIAGHSKVTLQSRRTTLHYTYEVVAPDDTTKTRFVRLLANGDQFLYLGMIRGNRFALTKKSLFDWSAPSVRGFNYAWGNLIADPPRIPPDLRIMHSGSCGRCGRELTNPESIERGIGPDCWEAIGGAFGAGVLL